MAPDATIGITLDRDCERLCDSVGGRLLYSAALRDAPSETAIALGSTEARLEGRVYERLVERVEDKGLTYDFAIFIAVALVLWFTDAGSAALRDVEKTLYSTDWLRDWLSALYMAYDTEAGRVMLNSIAFTGIFSSVEYIVVVPFEGFVAGTVTFTFNVVGGMSMVMFCAENEGDDASSMAENGITAATSRKTDIRVPRRIMTGIYSNPQRDYNINLFIIIRLITTPFYTPCHSAFCGSCHKII